MIGDVDARLKLWLASVAPEATISFDPPADGLSGLGVSVHLLDLLEDLPARGQVRTPLQFELRYMVTTWGPDVERAHQLLGNVVFAAMENAEVQVQFGGVPPEVWNAMGSVPRPHFFLRVPLRRDRPMPPAKPVLEPLDIKFAQMHAFNGVVLGPGDRPIADAFVAMPGFQLYTRTDSRGRFRFAAVPYEPQLKHFAIRAKGREFEVSAPHPSPDSEAALIHLELLEE